MSHCNVYDCEKLVFTRGMCRSHYDKARNSKLIKTRPIVRHGHGKTRLYAIWVGMNQRCYNKKNPAYDRYGGRGIKVCKEWRYSFLTFAKDMGERPSKYHSMDRKNNEGDYTPSNCHWVRDNVQAVNKRNNLNVPGVYKIQRVYSVKWHARLIVSHVNVLDKVYDSYDLAVAARKAAEKKYLN